MPSPKPNPKPGGWAFGEILSSSEMTQVNTNAQDSFDLTSGGAHTLSDDLTLNMGGNVWTFNGQVAVSDFFVGDDLTVTGDFVAGFGEFGDNLAIGGDLDVTGDITADDITADDLIVDNITVANLAFVQSLQVTGNAQIAGDVTDVDSLTASVTVQAADLIATDDLTVGDDATITDQLTAADLHATDDLTVGDDATIGGTLTADIGVITTDLTVGDDLTVVGDAQISGELLASDVEASTGRFQYHEAASQVISAPVDAATGATYNNITSSFCYISGTLSNSGTTAYHFRLPPSSVGTMCEQKFANVGAGGSDRLKFFDEDGSDEVVSVTIGAGSPWCFKFWRVAAGTGDGGSDWLCTYNYDMTP